MKPFNLEKELPPTRTTCIVLFEYREKKFITRATYIPRFTEEAYSDENEYCQEFNPENETWFFKEGWYEIPFFDDEEIFKFDEDCQVIEWIDEKKWVGHLNHRNAQ